MIFPNDTEAMPTPFSPSNVSADSIGGDTSFQQRQQLQANPLCDYFTFWLYGVVAGVVCIIGLVGNVVSIVILRRDSKTPVASFQLVTLAAADNLFLLLWFVHYTTRFVIRFYRQTTGPLLTYVRLYTFPVMYMAQTETIWLTVVVAFNRYMAVCLPYRAPLLQTLPKVYMQVTAVTVFAVLYNLPRCFELEITHVNVDGHLQQPAVNRTALGTNATYRLVYTDTLYYVLSFALPLVSLAFMNTRVITTYREASRRRRRMSSRRSASSSVDHENSVTLVMIVIVLVFIGCQSPARIVQIVWGYVYSDCRQVQYYLIHISNTLEVFNSSLNFVIYMAFHSHFRSTFLSWFPCCGSSSSSSVAGDSTTAGKETTGTGSVRRSQKHKDRAIEYKLAPVEAV